MHFRENIADNYFHKIYMLQSIKNADVLQESHTSISDRAHVSRACKAHPGKCKLPIKTTETQEVGAIMQNLRDSPVHTKGLTMWFLLQLY